MRLFLPLALALTSLTPAVLGCGGRFAPVDASNDTTARPAPDPSQAQGPRAASGACAPASAGVTILAARPDETWIAAMVVDASYVYWLEHGAEPDGAGRLMRVSKCGGDAALLATTLNYPAGLAVDDTNVYWSHFAPAAVAMSSPATGAVMRVPLGGGTPSELASGDEPGTVAVGASSVFWLDRAGLLSIPTTGGAVATLVAGPSVSDPAAVEGFAINTTHAVWARQSVDEWSLVAKPLAGGAVHTVVRSVPGVVGAVAVDDAWAFVVEAAASYGEASAIVRVPLGVAGVSSTLAEGHPISIALDAANVYWGDYPNRNGAGTVQRVGKAGGAPTVVVSGIDNAASLAVDASRVYWVSGNRVLSAPLAATNER